MSKDRRWVVFQELLRGATISSSGQDVTIACSSLDLKDSIMEMLAGDSLSVERQWITEQLEQEIRAAARRL